MDTSKSEILGILQEECSEVVVAVSKIRRFGIDSIDPRVGGQTNLEHLQEELGDLKAMIHLVESAFCLDDTITNEFAAKKLEKLKRWSRIDPELM